MREVTDRYNLTDRLNAVVAGAPAALAGGFFGFVQWFLGTIAAAGTVLVLMTYFMAAMPRLQQGVIRLFPPQRRDRVSQIVDVVAEKVGGYMIGNSIISLLAGAASFVCLRLVGVPFALPLAVVVAIADLIPMIGAKTRKTRPDQLRPTNRPRPRDSRDPRTPWGDSAKIAFGKPGRPAGGPQG